MGSDLLDNIHISLKVRSGAGQRVNMRGEVSRRRWTTDRNKESKARLIRGGGGGGGWSYKWFFSWNWFLRHYLPMPPFMTRSLLSPLQSSFLLNIFPLLFTNGRDITCKQSYPYRSHPDLWIINFLLPPLMDTNELIFLIVQQSTWDYNQKKS